MIIFLLLLVSFLLLLQTPPAPPVFATLTLRPGVSADLTGPTVGTVTLPAGVLTAQDDLPPRLHVLHQPHVLPHHVDVPDAADQPAGGAEEVAGGVGERVAAQVDVVPDVERLVAAPGPGGDGLLLVQLESGVLVISPEHQAVPLTQAHWRARPQEGGAGAQLVLDLQVTGHYGHGEPVSLAQPQHQDPLRVEGAE